MIFTFLGTGTSHGIPVIGCSCPVCTSSNEKNRRTRSSAIVQSENTTIIIDVTPEFRLQAIREGISHAEAIFLTHAHADHIHGLDDIRPLSWKKTIPVYANKPTLQEVKERFSYIFRVTQKGGGKPNIFFKEISAQKITVGDITVLPIPIFHGNLSILGYRIGNLSYLTDCSGIPKDSFPLLRGTKTLIIGALRYRPHETHFSVTQSLEIIRSVRPEKAFLTHLCHDLEHEELSHELPSHVSPAWDGLSFSF